MVSSGMPELGVEKILIRRNKAKKIQLFISI